MSFKFMGTKEGMTQVFDEKGNVVVCSVISVPPNYITQIKSKEKDGYQAIQLAAYPSKKPKNLGKPLVGHFAKSKAPPCFQLLESRVEDLKDWKEGQEISFQDIFQEGMMVDVSAYSKGKGFQGVIKRHGFRGGPAAHGSSFHRSAGSTGMRSTPGRNLPGGKKAGHMGDEKVTAQNLIIVKIYPEKNAVLIAGAIPGARNGRVTIRAAIKITKK